MKLAIAHPFLHTQGGAEKVVLKIAQHFDAKIFCTDYDRAKTYPEFAKLDVEVLPRGLAGHAFAAFPKRAREAAVAGAQYWNWKAPDEFDVVNAQGTPAEWARHRNEKVVWYCHNPNREAFILYEWRQARRNHLERTVYWSFVQAYKHFEFRTVPKIQHIFCNSETTRERIAKYLHRQDSEVLYPGVEFGEFACKDYQKFFFYPSRIVPEKRFELAIEAFAKFRKRMGVSKGRSPSGEKWKLVLAGSLLRSNASHVAYAEMLKHLASQHEGVELHFDVPFAKIRDWYARCYSVLYTPLHEDLGLVPVEGFAAKKACIAWNEGGPREVVSHGKDGFLVNGVEEMAAKMQWLAERPKMAEQMGKAGRKKAEKKFSWDVFLARFGKVCAQVAKQKQG